MYDIRFIDSDEWDDAINLTYRTFLQFDAPQFTEEGIESFRSFIADEGLKRMFENGELHVVGAYSFNKLVGVIALKDKKHVSLLFVDKDYHRKGIGRKLLMELSDFARIKLKQEKLTVNAAPYAVEFYRKCGFVSVRDEVRTCGIRYTPMEIVF